MLALNFETAHYAPAPLKDIRNLNPKTKILAWISLGFWSLNIPGPGYLASKLLSASTEDWWIHTKGTGDPSSRRLHLVSWYPGLAAPNPRSGFADYVVKFIHDEVMSTGLYDGVFYDGCGYDDWLEGRLADAEISVSEYRLGITNILRETRHNEGNEAIILGNPGVLWQDEAPYWDFANGHYQENALGDVFGADWNRMWEIYQLNMRKKSPQPRVHWIGVDTQYMRRRDDYSKVSRSDLTSEDLRRMRLGLGTTLLLDHGYFGFDRGDGWHGYGEQFWFFEYDANLGSPSRNYEKAGDGTYRRRYNNGLVLVNPGQSNRIIDLDGKYRDATTNEITSQVTVPGKDAKILTHT
jgi:hypothetical protein